MKTRSTLMVSIVTLMFVMPLLAVFSAPAMAAEKQGLSSSTSTIAPSYANYAPRPGDEKLKRDPAFVDYANSRIFIPASNPTQVYVVLRGYLPDACHQLRVAIGPTDAQNTISLQVYSLFDPSVSCVSVLQAFNVTIPLGTFASGHYTVMVNGRMLGEFDVRPSNTITSS
ncbi:MAG: hypothetical protein A2136_00265 [Chloroflexi bacterium RBG_16_54_11]|nr:MAG: hypothetical protein A2136_00265 [Chloroflexi bacterium RBG_16_54_11]